MSGGVIVSPASRDAVLPARPVTLGDSRPRPDRPPRSRAPYRPTHRRSRRNRRAGLSAAAVLVIAASSVGWTQVRGGDHAAAEVVAPVRTTAAAAATGRTAAVVCWDGAAVPTPRACGTPQGRSGMTSVFPAITASCRAGAATRPGTVEVYLCYGPGYVVRYTRWPAGYDRFSQLDRANGSDGTRWTVGGEFAGRTWSSRGATRPFRWAATYRSSPYSAEVLATDAAARTAGVATVRASRPGHVGR